MLLLRRPCDERIRQYLETQHRLDYSYRDIGATAVESPQGFVVDHTRAHLGDGDAVYQAAKDALNSWQQFPEPWVQACPGGVPPAAGMTIAILAQSVGMWWLNACRVVYTIDEPNRSGFANGTLADHAGCGEERFLVEITPNGEVWYDILAFSKPQHILAKVGYPLVRRVQKQFGRDSVAAMRRAVERRLKVDG